jgi:hypothetical protein
MKLPKFSSIKKQKEQDKNGSFLVLDLTCCSVKSLHFLKTGIKNFVVNGVSLRYTKNSISKEDIEEVLTEASVQADSATKDVVVGLSGANIIGFVLIVKNKRESSEKEITQEELSDLYEKVKETAYQQLLKKWSFISPEESGFVPLDTVVTESLVDGIEVDDPEGKTGEYIQVSVFCSYSEEKYFKWVTKTLSSLGYNAIAITSTVYTQSKLINEFKKNYLLVDIGQKYTEVSIILGEKIIQKKTYELGGEFFTKYLSDKLGLDYNSSNGKKEAFSMGTLTEEDSDQVGEHLYEAGKIWREGLNAVLISMLGIKSFPYDIVLSGGGAQLNILEELLYEEPWRQGIPFSQDIEVTKTSIQMWQSYILDQLNLLSGTLMFVPVSLGLISLELNNDE